MDEVDGAGPALIGAMAYVRDLDLVLPFYQDVLGLVVSRREGALAMLCRADSAPTALLLLRALGPGGERSEERLGVARLFWRLDGEDLDAARKRVERAGYRYWRLAEQGEDALACEDPDGTVHVLLQEDSELVELPPGSWLRYL